MDRDQAQALIIQQLMAGTVFDFKAICSRLMEEDPAMFVRLGIVTEPWITEARQYRAENMPIPCIKAMRNANSIGLWEAKQIWDRMRDHHGTMPCEHSRWTPEMERIYRAVKV